MSSEFPIDAILATGDFDALIGHFESEDFECKAQPYRLENDEEKIELAKDVSGIANAQGGIIVLGCVTQLYPSYREERIESIRSFDRSLLEIKQYRDILNAWLYPPLQEIDIQWCPCSNDSSKGIGVIRIPRATDTKHPVLVAKTILDNDKKKGSIFGYYERKQSNVNPHSVQTIQSLLRDGFRLDNEIRDGFSSLHAAIEQIKPPQVTKKVNLNIDAEFNAAITAAEFKNVPVFLLAAAPSENIELPSLFESRDSKLVGLIEKPPKIRNMGFNLISEHGSNIIEGRLRRAVTKGLGLFEVHRNGLIILVRDGNGNGLCWARKERQGEMPLINQLFLIETTYLFCNVVKEIFLGESLFLKDVTFHFKIQNLRKGNNFSRLELGTINELLPQGRDAPSDSYTGVSRIDLVGESPGQIAFKLVSAFYNWFGFESEDVPYTAEVDKIRVIDERLIVAEGG